LLFNSTATTPRTETPTIGSSEDDETANIIYSMIKEEIERFNKDLNEHLARTENIDTNVIFNFFYLIRMIC